MHREVDWLQPADNYILEYVRRAGKQTPKTISWNVPYGYSTTATRCPTLAEHGLLARVEDEHGGYAVGALVQANYGGILRIDGVPVGRQLGRYDFRSAVEGNGAPPDREDGSCMIVLATDAPVSPRNLERMAKRAMMGLARTGSYASNGSGDFVVAFSTRNRRSGSRSPRSDSLLPNSEMSPLFLGTVEAVEEAVYNALTAATTVEGRNGHVQDALPLDRLRDLLRDAGRIDPN